MSRTGSANGRVPAVTVSRKAEHIRINLQADVDAKGIATMTLTLNRNDVTRAVRVRLGELPSW